MCNKMASGSFERRNACILSCHESNDREFWDDIAFFLILRIFQAEVSSKSKECAKKGLVMALSSIVTPS